jgi:hypothetical protein
MSLLREDVNFVELAQDRVQFMALCLIKHSDNFTFLRVQWSFCEHGVNLWVHKRMTV